jgi:NAD-dependent SIR2 family protein deacetylase
LLIVGTSIQTQGIAELTRALAKQVHERKGLVVYINRDSLPGAKWDKHIDLHLKVEIEAWASETLDAYTQVWLLLCSALRLPFTFLAC